MIDIGLPIRKKATKHYHVITLVAALGPGRLNKILNGFKQKLQGLDWIKNSRYCIEW